MPYGTDVRTNLSFIPWQLHAGAVAFVYHMFRPAYCSSATYRHGESVDNGAASGAITGVSIGPVRRGQLVDAHLSIVQLCVPNSKLGAAAGFITRRTYAWLALRLALH